MKYFFSVDIAEIYSVKTAIVLKNIQFRILINKADCKHYYDWRREAV